MILVTGATGKVGSEAVRLLAARHQPTRALVRDPSRAPRGDVEIATGDFDRPETLDAAMSGIDTVLLVSPALPAQEIAVIDSAVRQGVTRVIKVTSKASADSPVDRRRGQAQIEAHLEASGLEYTLLRPNVAAAPNVGNAPDSREELVRLFTSSFRNGSDLKPADREYVSKVVAARTGLSQADSDKRVNDVVTQAKSDIDAARKAAAQLAFWLTASLLIGAFCASLAATEGGGLRDGTWSSKVRR